MIGWLLQRTHQLFVYSVYLLLVMALFDVIILKRILGYGYPRHYVQENAQRSPTPYYEFSGLPNVLDHNKFGFRGPAFDQASENDIKVAFFGGSTGYNGDPTIAEVLGHELQRLLNRKVFVANFSVVSSNHRQHLHMLVELCPKYRPDVIVFYGGFNETIASAQYDPRPGYPYNYFYRSEAPIVYKFLLENSAIFGELDKQTGFFSGLSRLRKQEQPFSEKWNHRIVEKYFETLDLARSFSCAIHSTKLGHPLFLAFHQPYLVPTEFSPAHESIKGRIRDLDYVFDMSGAYDSLGTDIFTDVVHVKQPAHAIMGREIARVVYEKYVHAVPSLHDVLLTTKNGR
jgi:hypothetical protein